MVKFIVMLCSSLLLVITASAQKEKDSTLIKLKILVKEKKYTKYITEVKKVAQKAKAKSDSLQYLEAMRYILQSYHLYMKQKDSFDLYFDKAKIAAVQYKQKEYSANFDFMRASFISDLGKLKEALIIFQDIENEAVANNYKFLPHYYSAYAKLNYFLKDHQEALEKLKKAAKIFENNNDLANSSAIYNNLGILYKSKKQLDSSIVYHSKSFQISKKLKDTIGLAYSYNNIGSLYYDLADYKNAKKYYDLAYGINPNNPTISLITNYSDLLYLTGKPKEAENLLTDVLQKVSEKDKKIEILRQLILVKRDQNDIVSAFEYQTQLIKEKEAFLNETKVKEIQRLKADYDLAQKEATISLLQEKNQLQDLANNQKRVLLIVLIIAFILALLIGFIYIKNRQQQAMVQKMNLEQRLLRSQMNPHFIFNTLASIQSFILEKKNKEAASYLSRFSRLIRIILDNSRENKVLFETELMAIENYIKLQQVRFENSFEFDILKNEELEENLDIQIPPMLFQPFVENAIEHGLRTKKENGKLSLDFNLNDDILTCVITDNGVGRTIAEQQKNKQKSSVSTKITQERLHHLLKGQKQNITIKDLYKNGNASGTKVTLLIPVYD